MAVVHIDKDLVAASARLLVVAMLAEGESYGYAILKRVHALSGGELEWTEGMLYPLLHRLRHLGYVTAEWRTTPEGRRRQYYVITDEGRAALADQQRQWVTVTRVLSDVWPEYGGLPTAVVAARAVQRVESQTAEWRDHAADAVGGRDHDVAP
jgi:PadR family transcriptional regulator PadR